MKTTLPRLTAAWALVIFLLLPVLARAETAVQAWVQRYNGPANGADQATAVALDGSNNVIVIGYSWSGADYDYATIKYSSAGVPVWTNRYTGPAGAVSNVACVLAVDGSNNVLVSTCSRGSSSARECVTLKYSGAGAPLWTNHYSEQTRPGDYRDKPAAIAVDHNNNVIVTECSGTFGILCHYTTLKYSSAGVLLWTNRYDGPGGISDYLDQPSGVVVDGSNNVIVTGYWYSSTTSGSSDYATIKYSSAGVPLWTNRYNGPGHSSDEALAVATDGSNNVVVTGRSYGSGSSADYATIKYSSAGVPLWTNCYNGSGNGNNYATAVAADGSNNVVVTGYSANRVTGDDYATD